MVQWWPSFWARYSDERHDMTDVADSQERPQGPVVLTDEQTAEMNHRAPDGLLGNEVSWANSSEEGAHVSVTLLVNGAIVTGVLIANWRWAELVNEQWVSALDGRIEKSVYAARAEEFKGYRDDHLEANKRWADLSTEEKQKAIVDDTPTFIHLEDASVVAGNAFIPQNGTLWRGRLLQVDAWCFGKLSTER